MLVVFLRGFRDQAQGVSVLSQHDLEGGVNCLAHSRAALVVLRRFRSRYVCLLCIPMVVSLLPTAS